MLGNSWGYKQPSQTARSRTVVISPAPDIFDSVLVLVVSALVIWRLLLPPEGSPAGETLWITQLWPLALVLWGVAQLRAGAWQVRWGWLDGLVWLLVGGHVLSATKVLLTIGDKRSSLNMLCEWIGIGVSFFLVRQVLVDRSDRRNLTVVLVAAAMVLAGLGLYQHFLGYKKLQEDFEKIERQWQQLDDLERQGAPQNPRARADWDAARNKIFVDLEQQKIPFDEHARILYRQRVRESSEPFGMFALANSFAGFLVCWLVVCIGILVESWRHNQPWRIWLPAAVFTAAVAYCLILTKSRTAYVGLITGLAAWGFGLARSLAANPRRIARWGLLGVATVVLVGGLAWATGGVDRLVLSESGKSLRYRFEYWRGTWSVLRESSANFLLGVGSGNFRQHYLAHKLPESSEEVLDPHNMLLDAWVNGGLLALIGLGGLCLAGAALVVRRQPASPESMTSVKQEPDGERKEGAETPSSSSSRETDSGVVINGFILGGAIGFLGAYLAGAALDSRLPILAVGWGVAVAACSRLFRENEMNPFLLGAAAIALLVHLLGAGGIGMPAITQTLLILLALGFGEFESLNPEISAMRTGNARFLPLAGVTAGIVLSVGCGAFALWPVTSRDNWLAEAANSLTARRNAAEADAAYTRATEADRLASEPWQKHAALTLQRALGASSQSEAEGWMQKAVEYQQSAIDRDPLNASSHRALGDYELEFSRRYDSTPWMERAAAAYAQAVARYPNSATLRSELAKAWWLAKKPAEARLAAESALNLHEINVQAGHPDKQLPEARLQLLRKILGDFRSGISLPEDGSPPRTTDTKADGSN